MQSEVTEKAFHDRGFIPMRNEIHPHEALIYEFYWDTERVHVISNQTGGTITTFSTATDNPEAPHAVLPKLRNLPNTVVTDP